jgi:hypothetical protein
VRDDPTLLARAENAQLGVLYAFLLRWEDLRKEADAAKVDWPMPESVDKVRDRVEHLVVRHGFKLEKVRMQ